VTGLLTLAPGSALFLDGEEQTVMAVEAQRGRVLLQGPGGEEQWRTIRWLACYPGCSTAAPAPRAGAGRQPPGWGDLTGHQQEVVRLRAAHVLEAETGFRSGDPRLASAGEPRPAYDPARTTLEQRRQAKAAELRSLGTEEARLLGLGQASERTLRRMAAALRDKGLIGLNCC
jgi:hypothetical protein